MGDKTPHLDAAYIEKKRHELTKLRDALRKTANATETEEGTVKGDATLQAREYEDDAQKLDLLEREGELVGRAVQRLEQVERALRKIEEGTYGYSDLSGARIPNERLDIMPEAITTLSEQKAAEQTDSSSRGA
jgi:DnaK suppressor protein